MNDERRAYLDRQRQFWGIEDAVELKFNRVDTLYGCDRNDSKFDEAADERVRWILDGPPLPLRPCILEIGCGIGAVISRVRAAIPDSRIWGVDISSTMIAEAKRLVGNDPSVHLEVTDGDRLPSIPSASMDLVVCTGVFIHILDIGVIQSYMSEAHRVLKPGGRFRFNARYWNPQYSFGESLGGHLARFLYRIGWHSSLKRAWARRVEVADFNGLYFTLNDAETLTREAHLIPEQFTPMVDDETPAKGLIRVNCRRSAANKPNALA